MNSLRRRCVALLLWLIAGFNIERLDLGSVNTLDLEPVTYAVVAMAVLLPFFSFFQKRPAILVIAAGWIALGIGLMLDPSPEFGGIHTYLVMVEFVLVGGAAFFAHRAGEALEEFRQAVETITLRDKNDRLHSLSDAQDAVQTQMSACRRMRRPLSVIVLEADARSLNMMMHRFVQDLQRAMMQRYVLAVTARVLARHLRRTDLIIEDDRPGRLILVAPETSEDRARALGDRLVRLVQDRLGITARYGVAAFPDHSLTFEDLLDAAERHLRQAQQEALDVPAQDTLNAPEVRA
ncbi:MAG: diguanylate cyclase [Roseiflexus sp.]|nr:diguanylate cyclase [Roseiflexus sp.]MCS7290024.1 diguanylate cyclase [Roseiflexus sp.]MDW8146431.1 diguanylate cyclase [Roseiflexaceae bacterium]MDW8233574.1 diguanylate cyclase [Roseiflexaceae bacterium]